MQAMVIVGLSLFKFKLLCTLELHQGHLYFHYIASYFLIKPKATIQSLEATARKHFPKSTIKAGKSCCCNSKIMLAQHQSSAPQAWTKSQASLINSGLSGSVTTAEMPYPMSELRNPSSWAETVASPPFSVPTNSMQLSLIL